MGVLDSIKDVANKGIATTGRAAKTVQLKAQLNEVRKQQDNLMKQLGTSLYEETKANPLYRGPRENIYASIEQSKLQCDALLAEIAEIERQGQLLAATGSGAAFNQGAALGTGASPGVPCPQCGSANDVDAVFCVGCGANITVISVEAPRCRQCGTTLATGLSFCTSCGTPIT
ncbi:MAG: zinc ribbon domain-containing protein [Coriobacteriales bacterium]|jgi:hypothetical protein|nr:zinc ribbon domain-containing protein [Coriobacteriales bacterium]